MGRANQDAPAEARISASGIVIDEASYSVKVHDKPLDLTCKEFELLRFRNPPFTRVYA